MVANFSVLFLFWARHILAVASVIPIWKQIRIVGPMVGIL
jgi:hypothetical protein